MVTPSESMWVLVADGARARVFQALPGGRLAPVTDLAFVGDDRPSREIASDRPGRGRDGGGTGSPGRHAVEPTTDPKRHEKASFAHDVAREVDHARRQQAFDHLVVVAPPQALGDLRQAFPKPLQDSVVAEVDKDYSKDDAESLAKHLAETLKSIQTPTILH